MLRELGASLGIAFGTIALVGVAYPLAVTGVAQTVFPHQANGSLVVDRAGAVVGSDLVGQAFSGSAYFQPRPSAAGGGWDALASGGSNLGPTSAKLRARAESDAARLRRDNPSAPGPVPVELVSASASGLDPHVSPGAARWQAPRVAAARGVSLDRVLPLVESLAEGRELGFLGEPRVNVLRLNRALDERFGAPPVSPR